MTDFSAYTDEQLSHHLRHLAAESGPLESSRVWMRLCHGSWSAARQRGRKGFRSIAQGRLRSYKLFEGWAVDDWDFHIAQVGAVTLDQFRELDPPAAWKLRKVDSEAEGHEGRITPLLACQRDRTRYRDEPAAVLASRVKASYPDDWTLPTVRRTNLYMVKSIMQRVDWEAVADALGWPHDTLPGRTGRGRRRYSEDPFEAARQIEAQGFTGRQIADSIGRSLRPPVEKLVVYLALPTFDVSTMLAEMQVGRCVEICTYAELLDEDVLKRRLPRLWNHARLRGWLRPSFWAKVNADDEKVTANDLSDVG